MEGRRREERRGEERKGDMRKGEGWRGEERKSNRNTQEKQGEAMETLWQSKGEPMRIYE